MQNNGISVPLFPLPIRRFIINKPLLSSIKSEYKIENKNRKVAASIHERMVIQTFSWLGFASRFSIASFVARISVAARLDEPTFQRPKVLDHSALRHRQLAAACVQCTCRSSGDSELDNHNPRESDTRNGGLASNSEIPICWAKAVTPSSTVLPN